MADVSQLAQLLAAGMMKQQAPGPMMADQGASSPTDWISLLRGPNYMENGNKNTPEIDPGASWGGKDRNEILPNDVMGNYLYGRFLNSGNI